MKDLIQYLAKVIISGVAFIILALILVEILIWYFKIRFFVR